MFLPPSSGQILYGRVLWNPGQNLNAAYELQLEKVYLCTGKDGHVPFFDPTGTVYNEGPRYGCIQPNKHLKHRFLLLVSVPLPTEAPCRALRALVAAQAGSLGLPLPQQPWELNGVPAGPGERRQAGHGARSTVTAENSQRKGEGEPGMYRARAIALDLPVPWLGTDRAGSP